MEWLSNTFPMFSHYMPALITAAVIVAIVWTSNRFLITQRSNLGAEAKLPRQLLILGLTLVGILILLFQIPMSEVARGQILGLLGIVLTGVIGLSSTTFVTNIMAGLMLRVVRSFRSGDFIRIGDQFGKVTDRGLFHTEIQTEDRDLTIFPNLFLITTPVTVVRRSGTIISTTLSLGYEIPRARIEALLIEAAEEVKLSECFVQVTEIGDYAVTYRIAGFLPEVKHLLTARSNLRKMVLDVLHKNGIEIVSPSFMNQRQYGLESRFIPTGASAKQDDLVASDDSPETIMFDKADEAEELDQFREELERCKSRNQELSELLKTNSESDTKAIKAEVESNEQRILQLSEIIETKTSDSKPEK